VETLNLLRRNPVLAQADPSRLKRLASACSVRLYPARANVVLAGTVQTHLLLVASGGLQLYRRNRETKTQLLVGVLEAPALFGDAELYAGARWAVSARAQVDTVTVEIPPIPFDALIGSDLAVAAGMYRETSARHFLTIEIIQVMGLQKTENKILRLLWERAKKVTGETRLPLSAVSQVNLAKALGVNRKTIARNMRSLERADLIRRQGDEWEILASERLFQSTLLTRHGFGASWKLPAGEED
jgi:CRP-like cAMP-binding protein